MDKKIISTVFPKIEFKKKFNAIIVCNIKFIKKKNKIEIFCESEEIISDDDIKYLENVILLYLEYLNAVEIIVKFTKGYTLDEVIRKYFNIIIKKYEKEKPFVFVILKSSKHYIKENILYIEVNKDLYFYITEKKIGRHIKNIIKEKFSLDITIIFKVIDSKINSNEYEINKNLASRKAMRELNDYEVQPKIIKETEIKKKYKTRRKNGTVFKQSIEGNILSILDCIIQDEKVIISGEIFELNKKEIRNGKLLISFDIFDISSAVTIKFFADKKSYTEDFSKLKEKANVIIKGYVRYDDYAKELNIMAEEICENNRNPKKLDKDLEKEKRVELHLHTNMSSMDGITQISDYIIRAKKWGHKALAITDHGVLQSFPEAMKETNGKDLKIIYGVEAYLIDDIDIAVKMALNQKLNCEYVVFDLETTGFYSNIDKIIEIGAVKIKNGKVIDKYSVLINPKIEIPEHITKLTNITNSMVSTKDTIADVLPLFMEFVGEAVLVAHNISFDLGFLNKACKDIMHMNIKNTFIDTLTLSQSIYPEIKNYKLDTLAKSLGYNLNNHHRALEDATITGEIFQSMIEILESENITKLCEINKYVKENIDYKKLRPTHCIILVKNKKGLKNLYKLTSDAHINNFYRNPRVPKSELVKNKEGLLIGSACEAGELFKSIFNNMPYQYIENISKLYDYFEIQPLANNYYLFGKNAIESEMDLVKVNEKIIELGCKNDKLTVATGDVHYLEKEDKKYREILMNNKGFKDAHNQPPLYYRTTENMLNEFNYLGEKKALEVVVKNTNIINNLIEKIKPIPDGTFPPIIDGADNELEMITYNRAKSIYGTKLPSIVEERLKKELNSIINNGFSVMYIIAQKLVCKSVKDGYLVGSRGSVGSSFVATMAEITEVNPLKPHYYCKICKFSDFDSKVVQSFEGLSGYDMPDKQCPKCGEPLVKEGHDIPFETFLGFDGDKEPDIDLNFSGEYQSKAHEYTEELFGKGYVYKAGTIGTIADKTAFIMVSKYFEKKGEKKRKAEINKLKKGCIGVRRSTGQHPGGLMIVPRNYTIYDFCPIQRAANDQDSNIITTHFDYHAISGRLLKLDILGHDNPTIIKMLYDTTGIDSRDLNLGDKKVMSLFFSPEALGVTKEEIGCNTGSLGLPEFGTPFVRKMLEETKPNSFAELVRISGLSHGTDVWINNGQDLIEKKIATLKEIIPTRDDIMVYLIQKGLDDLKAFKIMENVRKGKGLTEEEEKLMIENNVPNWYIISCKKIKYMFPKGHAVAYVMMTVRIAFYKINYPYAFYQAIFSVKGEDFDFEIMCRGKSKAEEQLKIIKGKGNGATAKEKSTLVLLELCIEFYARGLVFDNINIYESDDKKFKRNDIGLLPPLSAISGLGGSAGENVVEARKNGKFLTIEDFRTRTKVNKTVIEILKNANFFKGMSETNQLSLLDIK